jgi:hypothetical protein
MRFNPGFVRSLVLAVWFSLIGDSHHIASAPRPILDGECTPSKTIFQGSCTGCVGSIDGNITPGYCIEGWTLTQCHYAWSANWVCGSLAGNPGGNGYLTCGRHFEQRILCNASGSAWLAIVLTCGTCP